MSRATKRNNITRWVRLNVEYLEARVQASAGPFAPLDHLVAADQLFDLEIAMTNSDAPPVLKRLQGNEALRHADKTNSSGNQHDVCITSLGRPPSDQRPNAMPSNHSTMRASSVIPAMAARTSNKFLRQTQPEVTRATPRHVQATIQPIQITSVPSLGLRFEHRVCTGSAGGKATIYNTYGGTVNFDENLAVASGKGPNLGKAYAVGHEGLDGSVRSYLPNGACEFSLTVTGPSSVEVRDVATNNNGIYVAGAIGGGNVGAFILRLDSTLMVVGQVNLAPPPGGLLSLNGIGISPNAGLPDVFATGLILDPSIHVNAVGFATSYDSTLTVLRYSTTFSFGGVNEGFSIDADRGRNAYIGARFVTLAGAFNATLRINSGGLASPWGVTFPSPGHPDEAMHGVRVLGGTSSAAGLYAAGLVGSSTPGVENLIIAKLDPATGSIAGPNYYAWVYSFGALSRSGWDIAVDRVGNAYVAGRTGTPSDFDAFATKIDPTGAVPLASTFLGAPGFDDRGTGIDIETAAPSADVFMAGTTNTPSAQMIPPPLGCDITWNGLNDGFVAGYTQPL